MTKILYLDIESTNLALNFGWTLCVGWATNDSDVRTFGIDDFYRKAVYDDSGLMKYTYNLICEHDVVVGWFSKRFDWKALQTRMILAGCPPLPPVGSRHIDLYDTAKLNFRLSSYHLDTVARHLQCPFEKTPGARENPGLWLQAVAGERKALGYVEDHCAQDVQITRWVYNTIRPYIRQHPVVGDRGSCHVCGSVRLQFRGYSIRASKEVHEKRRVQCQDCGAWDLRGPTEPDVTRGAVLLNGEAAQA